MNALIELKKKVAPWLPVDRVFKSMTLGELWCKQPPPPIADSCLGRICQNGTCMVCSMTTADKEASLEAFHEEKQCCAICGAVGTVAIPGLGVTEPHSTRELGRETHSSFGGAGHAWAHDGCAPRGRLVGGGDVHARTARRPVTARLHPEEPGSTLSLMTLST